MEGLATQVFKSRWPLLEREFERMKGFGHEWGSGEEVGADTESKISRAQALAVSESGGLQPPT